MGVKDWADLDDNRIGPLLKELAEAIEDTDDPEMLQKVQSRLKFMSSSVNSLKQRKLKNFRGW